jgi:signal transduction histidine kinase
MTSAKAKIRERWPSLQDAGWPIARHGWYVCAAVALTVLLTAGPGYLTREPMGGLSSHLIYEPTPFMAVLNGLNQLSAFGVALLSLLLAAVLHRKRARDRMGLFLAYYLLAHGVLLAGPIEMLEYIWPGVAAFNSFVLLPWIMSPLAAALLALFPDGRFVPGWTRWAVVAVVVVGLLTYPLSPARPSADLGPEPPPRLWLGYGAAVGLGLALIYAQVKRYRHVSTPVQHQQTKWVLYGFLAMLVLMAAGGVPWRIALNLPPESMLPWWVSLAEMAWVLGASMIPVSLTLAVMRYRLYDIDLIINRTVVYGTLTLCTMALYVFIVGFLGNLIQSGDRTAIAFFTTGLVAVIFQPLRQRLQRAVNHFMYGQRDEPFEALARLGRRLEAVASREMVYPTIVETVAQALRLPYAAIAVRRGEVYEVAEAYGRTREEPIAYPLVHQGEVFGRLLVAPRSPDEAFSTADERLLRSFARQLGSAVYAVQLTADLQRSRRQLVSAREEERQRLRRDLHDGLGPTLASVVWQADSARDLVYSDPGEAERLLEASIEQARAALGDIRRLVYGLRPPALDELGLAGALEQAVRRHPQTTVAIEAPEPLPSLPAAVEVAAYRIVQEAIRNAVEHGGAEHCVVRLTADGCLRLTIRDDGHGLPAAPTPGVGLVSMRQRAEELGGFFAIQPGGSGGTELEVRLPLHQDE